MWHSKAPNPSKTGSPTLTLPRLPTTLGPSATAMFTKDSKTLTNQSMLMSYLRFKDSKQLTPPMRLRSLDTPSVVFLVKQLPWL